jgi:hypothetical protein
VDEPVIYNKLIAKDLHTIETISDRVQELLDPQWVQTPIYHAKRLFRYLGETRLREML